MINYNLISSVPQNIYPGKQVTLRVTYAVQSYINWGNSTNTGYTNVTTTATLTVQLLQGTTVYFQQQYTLTSNTPTNITFTVPNLLPGVYTLLLTAPNAQTSFSVAIQGLSQKYAVYILNPINGSTVSQTTTKVLVRAVTISLYTFANGTQKIVNVTPLPQQTVVITAGFDLATAPQQGSLITNASGYGTITIALPNTAGKYYIVAVLYGLNVYNYSVVIISPPPGNLVNTTTFTNYNYTNPFSNPIQPNSVLYDFSKSQPWAFIVGVVAVVLIALLGWKFGGSGGASGGAVMGLIATSYLGLIPWYLFYIFVFGIALLLAKVFVDKFMGREE
jgi:hypothetical protein